MARVNGKASTITKKEIEMLEAIGFVWVIFDKAEDTGEEINGLDDDVTADLYGV